MAKTTPTTTTPAAPRSATAKTPTAASLLNNVGKGYAVKLGKATDNQEVVLVPDGFEAVLFKKAGPALPMAPRIAQPPVQPKAAPVVAPAPQSASPQAPQAAPAAKRQKIFKTVGICLGLILLGVLGAVWLHFETYSKSQPAPVAQTQSDPIQKKDQPEVEKAEKPAPPKSDGSEPDPTKPGPVPQPMENQPKAELSPVEKCETGVSNLIGISEADKREIFRRCSEPKSKVAATEGVGEEPALKEEPEPTGAQETASPEPEETPPSTEESQGFQVAGLGEAEVADEDGYNGGYGRKRLSRRGKDKPQCPDGFRLQGNGQCARTVFRKEGESSRYDVEPEKARCEIGTTRIIWVKSPEGRKRRVEQTCRF